MHIEITKSAIDNASNRVRGIWAEKRIMYGNGFGENEGLWSWLERMTREAIMHGDKLQSGKYRYAGIKFTVAEATPEAHVLRYILQAVERVKS